MQKTFISLAVFLALSLPYIALANTCGEWQSKLKSTQRKLDNSRNQSQIRQWKKESNYFKNELDKCNKKNGTHRWIAISDGKSQQPPQRRAREKLRPINTDNAQLRQIIATCNYWIDQYNQNATDNNRAFKNSACINADKATQEVGALKEKAPELDLAASPLELSVSKRTLKECMKPNNRIDEDVKRCMQGEMTPERILNP
jgi:hypothetical protein